MFLYGFACVLSAPCGFARQGDSLLANSGTALAVGPSGIFVCAVRLRLFYSPTDPQWHPRCRLQLRATLTMSACSTAPCVHTWNKPTLGAQVSALSYGCG